MPSSGLIVTADDYGRNESINKGTLAGVKAGIVSSVHVMMNYVTDSAMQQLIEAVNAADHDCGIGLHLNTTDGRSLKQEKTNFTRKKNGCYRFRSITDYRHA